jgi:hypothetical protein
MRQFAVAALAVLTAGCLPVTVYQQANPNPLRGHHTFVLRPLDTTTLLIDGAPLEMFLESKARSSGWSLNRSDWEKIIADLVRAFGDQFVASSSGRTIVRSAEPTPGVFVVQPRVTSMDLGRNSKDMTILIRIVDATGQVVDDVSVEEWSTDWNGVAGDLAMRAARYVLSRTE